MAENLILPFASTNTGSNLLSQAEYEVDRQRLTGNEPGVARSALVNKVLKQSSLMASGLGTFMAKHAAAADGDVSDTMSPDEVADYLSTVISRMAGSGGSSLPAGGETGMALVKQSDVSGDAGWQYLAGVPVGTLIPYAGREAPPGFLSLNTAEETFVAVDAFAQLAAAVYCGDDFNDSADFFYRFDAGMDGIVRHSDGAYLALPAASQYFLRGRDASGEVHPYRYQGDAIRNIEGTFGVSPGTGGTYIDQNNISGAFTSDKKGTGQYTVKNLDDQNGSRWRFDASLVVPTADETRPMNFPVLWCIKAFDEAVNATEFDIQALASAVAVLDSTLKHMPLSRVWVSDLYQPVAKTKTIISHNLGLSQDELLRARCEVMLECVVAQSPYIAGDVLRNVSTSTTVVTDSGYLSPVLPLQRLDANSAELLTGSNGLITTVQGGPFFPGLANWRYRVALFY